MVEQDDLSGPDGSEPGARDSGRRRRIAAVVGPVVLLVLMIGTALFAALTVTPPPDDEALQRPADSDLVVGARAPAGWDPAAVSDAGSAQILSQVFEGLTVLDGDGVAQPALAERWEIAADGRSVTFALRPGLTFSDGTPITGEDVRRSWLRVLDPAAPSPLASILDDIVGASAYAAGQGTAEAVGVTADDDRVSVRFERPAAYFPSVAAVPTLAIVPPGIEAARDAIGLPDGLAASGAYAATVQTATDIRLEANDAYWAGPPPIERITIVTDDGGRSNVETFEDGAVDWTAVGASDAAWIRWDRRLGPQLRASGELVTDLLAFDTTEPPFDDARVRAAIGFAVDWRRIGALDGEAVATSLLPPGLAGRDDTDHLPAHDPERGRALLAEAGYPGGAGFPSVDIATYGVGPTTAIAAEIERELGIDVRVERRPFGEHSALLDLDPPAMWTLGWSADYPHAHDFLGLLLRSDSRANVGRWRDATFDALIDAAASTDDLAEQTRLYAEAQRIVRDEVPLVPLGYGRAWALSRDGLAGAQPTTVGILRFAGLDWER